MLEAISGFFANPSSLLDAIGSSAGKGWNGLIDELGIPGLDYLKSDLDMHGPPTKDGVLPSGKRIGFDFSEMIPKFEQTEAPAIPQIQHTGMGSGLRKSGLDTSGGRVPGVDMSITESPVANKNRTDIGKAMNSMTAKDFGKQMFQMFQQGSNNPMLQGDISPTTQMAKTGSLKPQSQLSQEPPSPRFDFQTYR